MKTSPHSTKAANAFTLIELLVVITIIGILVALLMPAFSYVKEYARKVSAKSDETQIVNAIKWYYSEYQKYPAATVVTSGTLQDTYFGAGTASAANGTAWTPGGTNDELFDVLRNNTASTTKAPDGGNLVAELNPRGIVFLDVPAAKNASVPQSGIDAGQSAVQPGAWFDPWGSQYNIVMNTSGSGYLNNPYQDNPGGATLGTTVIVWAYGMNGAMGGSYSGGSATTPPPPFSVESGSPNNYTGSGDVLSWQ